MMMRSKVVVLSVAVGALLASCTDADRSKWNALGDPALVECYSGTKLIYQGCSTGKVGSEQNSDGYYFRDQRDNLLRGVSGNCVIVYQAPDCA